MRKLTLSLLAGGLLALLAFADKVTTGVKLQNNAEEISAAAGPDRVTDTDYYAAFYGANNPLNIRDLINKDKEPHDFSADNEVDLCDKLVNPDKDNSKFAGVLIGGIKIDPGSVIHLTFDAPQYMVHESDSSYQVQITKVKTHMCYYYLGDNSWKNIKNNDTLKSKFDYFYDKAEYRVITPKDGAEIDTDVPVPNLTGDDTPDKQVKVYFIFSPTYHFPGVLKAGMYKAEFTITVTGE